ncbi:MAG: glycerophosphodiester phosphodiesterase [Acidobacteriota bacterium]
MNQHDASWASTWPYPFWIAHRGAGKLAPENTLSAFRLGAANGFAMFECDVTLSADGEAYLLHDARLERTTDGQGLAVAQVWADLSYLDAGSWHSPAYAGEPLLRLGALARWLQANQLLVNLEIKPGPGDDIRCGEVVANEVARLWTGAAVPPLLSSFQVDALRAAKQAQPGLPRALLLEAWADDWRAQVAELDCVALVVQHAHLSPERIAQIHQAGIRALTYTVNEEARARELAAAGLDGLITDRVDLFGARARSMSA